MTWQRIVRSKSGATINALQEWNGCTCIARWTIKGEVYISKNDGN